MEYEIEEHLDGGLWEWDSREKARSGQIDRQGMARKALDIPESEEV